MSLLFPTNNYVGITKGVAYATLAYITLSFVNYTKNGSEFTPETFHHTCCGLMYHLQTNIVLPTINLL